MSRFEMQGQFYFPNQTTQAAFASAAQSYIDSHPSIFFGYTPLNQASHDHSGGQYQLVQCRFGARTDLDSTFDALVTQATNRGAVAPSNMWVREVDDAGEWVPGGERDWIA